MKILKQNYEIIHQIGQGSWSCVFYGRNTKKNKEVAIKKIFKHGSVKLKINKMIDMMKTINCKHSIQFYEYYEDSKNYYIILELCQFTLYEYINDRGGKLEIKVIKDILIQLREVFKLMNEHNIIHGNINLNYILLRFPGNKIDKLDVVLCDYGLPQKKPRFIGDYEIHDFAPEYIYEDQYIINLIYGV